VSELEKVFFAIAAIELLSGLPKMARCWLAHGTIANSM
jgi:hypothetical protein